MASWHLQLDRLLEGLPREGVVHVGAHDGREAPFYTGFGRVILVEPLPHRAEALRQLGYEVVEAAVTSRPGPVVLNVTSRDEGSSLLTPKVTFNTVRQVTVDAVPLNFPECNVLVVDTQGTEPDVLTAGPLNFDLIVVEASETVRYQDGATEADVMDVLDGWQLVERFPHPHSPGVADLVFRCGS